MTDKASSGTDSRNYDRLLPCPFCGAEPEPINGGEYMFFDHADTCHFEMMRRARSVKMVPEEIAAWNTRTTHGTLTAEQVRKAAVGHYKLRLVLDVDGFDVPQVMFDWQAIADELNATLGETLPMKETR